MPVYDFECKNCGHKFSVMCSWREKDDVKCPECGESSPRQLFTGFAYVKGSCASSSSSGSRGFS